jgi:hypothetical protein
MMVMTMVTFVVAIPLMMVMFVMRVAAPMEMGTTLTGRCVRTGTVAVSEGVAHHEERHQ